MYISIPFVDDVSSNVGVFAFNDGGRVFISIEQQENLFHKSFDTNTLGHCINQHIGVHILELKIVSQEDSKEDIANFHFEIPTRWIFDVVNQVIDERATDLIEIVNGHG